MSRSFGAYQIVQNGFLYLIYAFATIILLRLAYVSISRFCHHRFGLVIHFIRLGSFELGRRVEIYPAPQKFILGTLCYRDAQGA